MTMKLVQFIIAAPQLLLHNGGYLIINALLGYTSFVHKQVTVCLLVVVVVSEFIIK